MLQMPQPPWLGSVAVFLGSFGARSLPHWGPTARPQTAKQMIKVPYPQSWRQILISFMPKIPRILNLKDGRLLCMQNKASRWFSSCTVLLADDHVERNGVFRRIGLYGFQEHGRTHDITASLKHIGQHAANWGKGGTPGERRRPSCVRPLHGGQCQAWVGSCCCAFVYVQYALLNPLCECVGMFVLMELRCWRWSGQVYADGRA
eukprot:1331073-Pyramimonas_sp.AAC.1